ncbi:hypothetical protein B9Z19DRAFT_1136753 [Tuber borchii]|uniref:DNA-directed RNA polymerase n=1 Tax=Tuber borchii TaxID=42251 RepID=A0A2T6ZB97_TUBBO|nr:hypothetical protein B9Z19DRAFT_1136753 [Tuber borchii]
MEIFRKSVSKYKKAKVEPRSAVAAVGTQSISQPGTHITMKPFHSASIAPMNVTPGVPLIKESSTLRRLLAPLTEERERDHAIRTSQNARQLASFEKTTDPLFETVFYVKRDAVKGVSECILRTYSFEYLVLNS